MVTRQEISKCLSKAKRLINCNKKRIAERDSFMKELVRLGLTVKDAIDIVYSLLPANYYRGPTAERDSEYPPGDVWEFIKQNDGVELYIKFKIYSTREGEILHIFRFHETE